MPITKRLPGDSYRCRLYIGTETSFVNGVEKRNEFIKALQLPLKRLRNLDFMRINAFSMFLSLFLLSRGDRI